VTTTTTTEPGSLERRLGPLDGAAIIISNVIGGGILFLPPVIASSVPNAPWFLSTWIVGGLLAFAGALAYAELAALRPRAGGEYVYLRDAYGLPLGFLTGWTSFVAGFSGAAAASAVGFTLYLDRFIPGSANSSPLFAIPLPFVPVTFSRQTIVASAVLVAVALVHIRGIGPGRVMMNALATGKTLALVAFIALGLSLGAGEPSNLQQSAGAIGLTGWMLAMVPMMFLYSGWNAAAYMAEEIRNPGRNIPVALLLGTALVTAIYVLLNVLFLFLGMFLHSAAAIILVVPVVMPLVKAVGIDPVHFGLIVTISNP